MHEVENMMFVGETPWHTLGKRLIKAPTAEEAIVAAGLDWTVGLKPLFTADNEAVPAKATFRESDGRILGVVGPTYKPLQNKHAFDFFNPFLAAGEASLETAGSLRNGQRVWVLAKINRDPSIIVPGDEVEKYVLLSNSHDGTLAIRVGFTPIRVVCNNTLSMAIDGGSSQLIRIRHTEGAMATLEKVREIMDTANSRFEATAEQYRALARMSLSEEDLKKYVKMVFMTKAQEAEESEGAGERILSKIVPLFEQGRGNNMPGVAGTMWAAYNAVTEYIQYERGKDVENRLDSTWFGTGHTLNKKALETALIMVKLAA